jgi:hypothetical protein
MKKAKLYFLFCFVILTNQLNAQESTSVPVPYDKVSIGAGFGQDYGGIGVNLAVYPLKSIGIFGGLGYNLVGAGYNVGAKLRLVSSKPTAKVTPFALGMYGYNAVIRVSGASQFNKVFYGPTFGAGIDFKSYPRSKILYSFALMVPIRSSEVDEYMDDLTTNHYVEFTSDLIPVTFSIGFKYILK